MLSFARKVRKNVKNSIPSHQTQPICSNQPPVVSAKIVNEKDSEKILSVIRIARYAISAVIYLFNVSNGNTRIMCEICSKLKITAPEQRHRRRYSVFVTH